MLFNLNKLNYFYRISKFNLIEASPLIYLRMTSDFASKSIYKSFNSYLCLLDLFLTRYLLRHKSSL